MMKNLSILKQFLAFAVLLFVVTSCNKKEVEVENPEQQQEASFSEIAMEDLPTEISEPSYELARIQKDGHEYLFVAIGEENEMIIIENLYGLAADNFEESGIAEDVTPYEAFLSLTDDDVMVPARLAATVDEAVIATSSRQVSESTSTLEIMDNNYTEPRDCYDVGYNNFYNTYCGGTRYTAENDIRFCDNWLGTWSGRESNWNGVWTKHRKVRTWTNVICGKTSIGIYNRKNPQDYRKIYSKWLYNGIWYVNLYPNTYEWRAVGRTALNGGKFRAYTRFSN